MNRNIARKLELKQNPGQINDFMNSDSSKAVGITSQRAKLVLIQFVAILFLNACNSTSNEPIGSGSFSKINPSATDELLLADGFTAQVLIKGMDTINENNIFGYDVSGLLLEEVGEESATLIVNHEMMNPMLATGFFGDMARMRSQIRTEQNAVGVSSLSIKRDGNKWLVNSSGKRNKITADTDIPLGRTIAAKSKAKGTTANRSILKTPWNSLISAESAYEEYYGDIKYGSRQYIPSRLQWESFVNESPYLYGWLLEMNSEMDEFQKLSGPGRLKRGGIALTIKDDQAVLYSTDRRTDGCLYKFVSNSADNLEKGEIYVANFSDSKWELISYGDSAISRFFTSEEQMLTELSVAGQLVGGTPLDNPSGLAIDPATGDLLMAVTNNTIEQRYHGSIMKITDSGIGFSWDTIIEGSIDNNISCPSRLAFDQSGNLWIATGIPAALLNQGVYKSFGNNGLFVLPKGQPEVAQVASAPADAKFSGITFTPDDKFLFLGVQQPGSRSTSIYDFDFTSHWPAGGKSKPRSGVVVIGREG